VKWLRLPALELSLERREPALGFAETETSYALGVVVRREFDFAYAGLPLTGERSSFRPPLSGVE
jgi:hypothetical protein